MKPLTIRTDDFTVRFDLGDGAPTITGGPGSGWQLVDVVQGRAVTDWQGSEPLQLDVPVLLDGYADGESRERDFRRLIRLGYSHDGQKRPPIFHVSGPIPGAPGRFILNGTPSPDDQIRRERDGALMRWIGTIPLMAYSSGGRLRPERERQNPNVYVTKKGQTLRDVAKAVYHGHVSEWARLIGKENGIRDVRRKLPAGKRLRLPDTFSVSGGLRP